MNMKKDEMKVINKYKFIKNKQTKYISDKLDLKSKKELFDKTLVTILQLKECEEEYMKIENHDIDIHFGYTFEDIDLEELSSFWEINVNNEKIQNEKSICFGDDSYVDKPENDNSGITVRPVFDRIDEDEYSNRIIGVKFIIQSQMGYEINLTEVSLDDLKRVQEDLNNYIERIVEQKSIITVKGYKAKYTFTTSSDWLEFPKDGKDRTELLQIDHGLPKNYKVTKVERNKIGDETWTVEKVKI